MGLDAKAGTYIAKAAAKLGVKRFFRPSLQFSEVEFEPIRRPGDDVDEGVAIIYTINVKNVGSKAAESCRTYLEVNGVWEPDGEFSEVMRGKEEIDFDADRVDFSLETQVYWNDDVEPKNHFQEGVSQNIVSDKSLSPGETGTVSFAMVIGGNDQRDPTIRFPTADGFKHSAKPDIKFDGKPYTPPVAGDESAPSRISIEIPVKELDRYDWDVSRIYVTGENIVEANFPFRFLFKDDQFTIKHESVDESVFDT